MNNAPQLANRFREVLLNGTFVANTNYKDKLSGTGWEMVTTQLGELHTIAVLAQHVHYYIAGVKRVLQGGSLDIKDELSFDFPSITHQEQWDNFLQRFWKDAEEFADLVAQLPEAQLGEVFVSEKYGSYQRNIDGTIEHCYYHLGQIALIQKMLGA